jgi:hypothetical protein
MESHKLHAHSHPLRRETQGWNIMILFSFENLKKKKLGAGYYCCSVTVMQMTSARVQTAK